MTPDVLPTVSNPPFFVTLIAGLMMAFAFQLLLTSFGIAAGVTALGYLPGTSSSEEDTDESGSPISVSFAVGLSTLLTVNTVLFLACFLAVKLSLVQSIVLGAIFGVVIWSAYFLLLMWISVSAVGSVLGAVFGTIAAGMRGITQTVTRAFHSPKSEPTELVAASTAAIRQEMNAALTGNKIEETIQNYLQKWQPPQLELAQIRQQLEQILQETQAKSPIGAELLNQIDLTELVNLLQQRTDFSKAEIAQMIQELDAVWQNLPQKNHHPETDLVNFFATAKPDELTSTALSTQLQPLTEANSATTHPLAQIDFKRLLRTVLSRVDLSDLDVEKVLTQVRAFLPASQISEPKPFSTIQTDIEDYLLNAYPWNLTRKTVQAEFKDVIYDSEADPQLIRQQLEQVDRDDFVSLLEQRGDLSPAKIAKIADRLATVQQEVFAILDTTIAQTEATTFQQHIKEHLRFTKRTNLKPSALKRQFNKFAKAESQLDVLASHLSQLDYRTFLEALQDRADLSESEVEKLVEHLETIRDTKLAEIKDTQENGKVAAITLWQKLEAELQDTSKKLNVRNLKRSLNRLVKEAAVELAAMRPHLPTFDRNAVMQLLEQRQDLSQKRIKQVTEHLEKAWNSLLEAPQKVVAKTKQTYSKLTVALTDYLQQQNLTELDLDHLEQELPQILAVPAAAAGSWQLTQIDWNALGHSLKEQTEFTEAEINRAIAQLQTATTRLGRAPRRFAIRTQSQLQDFRTIVEDYLRNTDKEELNPEAIKRDIQQLLNDPRTGIESLRERLAQFDRSTLAALLAQRGDFTEAEIETVIEQIQSASQQVWQRLETVQKEMQATISTVLNQLSDYLSSLRHPEFNYDQIQQDLLNLLEVPQLGFEMLSDSLQTLNHDALTALVNARDDLSETVTQQVLDRLEAVRTHLLTQVENLQLEAQKQVETLTQQAQQKAEATRKAIAIAAWWLFSTAFTSAITAATAGAIAVGGLDLFNLNNLGLHFPF
jgi:uncharacterized protein YfkK (UPF0435 family)